jgi:hypothetical protein
MRVATRVPLGSACSPITGLPPEAMRHGTGPSAGGCGGGGAGRGQTHADDGDSGTNARVDVLCAAHLIMTFG